MQSRTQRTLIGEAVGSDGNTYTVIECQRFTHVTGIGGDQCDISGPRWMETPDGLSIAPLGNGNAIIVETGVQLTALIATAVPE